MELSLCNVGKFIVANLVVDHGIGTVQRKAMVMGSRRAAVAAVVVTYNRKRLLSENIIALKKQTYPGKLDIIIIDNASTDGTGDMVREMCDTGSIYPQRCIVYENTGKNLGGAGGFQYGIRWAVEHGYEYLWLMDDDCVPEADALDSFLQADEKLPVPYGWLSSQVRWRDGSICAMNVQRRTMIYNADDWETHLVPCVMASFVSLFLRAEVVRKVGLPIKEFFIWTDDWEYTRRISLKYPCYLVNTSRVVHKSAVNIPASLADDVPERLPRYRYLYRNDVYLYRREGLRGFCYEVVRLFVHIVRVLLKSRDRKVERIGILLSGTWVGMSFHPAIEFLDSSGEATHA